MFLYGLCFTKSVIINIILINYKFKITNNNNDSYNIKNKIIIITQLIIILLNLY
jgi:hypothetical protein